MNYAGFARPVWQWLKHPEPVHLEPGPFTPFPRFAGTSIVRTMRAFAAAQPWRATAHALNLVGSHDVPRIATFLEDDGLVTVAFGLLASMPGIPMLWAGDEIGQRGVNGEDGRRPFPWHDTGQWDNHRLATNRSLFGARALSPALRHGGLRWLSVRPEAITFLREAPEETVLVHAARSGHDPVRLPVAAVGSELAGIGETPSIRSAGDGTVTLPGHGPAFSMWRLSKD
jgi:alpha-glucosidase